MSRLPSIGFAYLATTVVAFALIGSWLVQPLWFERPEPESSRSRATYLLDMAYACQEPERTDRLRSCLDQGFHLGQAAGNWNLLLATLDQLHNRNRKVDGITSRRVGDAWLVGKAGPTENPSQAQCFVLAYNEQTDPRDLELLWTGNDDLSVSIKPQFGAATQLSFHDDKARQVLEGLAPAAASMFLVQSPGLQSLELVEARWL